MRKPTVGCRSLRCVRWNDHHPFLIELLHNLQVRESFVDVTLAAEGRFIRVHRLILGACSHYFEVRPYIAGFYWMYCRVDGYFLRCLNFPGFS